MSMDTTIAGRSDIALLMETREACRSGRARELREAAGLSQIEVARACGVTEGAISHWEAGTRRPTGDRAVAYGRVLCKIAQWAPAPGSTQPSEARKAPQAA